MTRTVIAGYARSPFTLAKKGELARVRPDDLAAQVVAGAGREDRREARGHRGPDPRLRLPGGRAGLQRRAPGRLAGGPAANRSAGARSTASAARRCSRSISRPARSRMDAGEVFICAGVESMSRVPMMGFNPLPNPGALAKMPAAYIGMGDTAENVAAQMADRRATSRRSSRCAQPAAAPPPRAGRRQVRRRDRADRKPQRRGRRPGRLHPPRHHARRRWPG